MRSYKCVCCGFEINPIEFGSTETVNIDYQDYIPEEGMWDGGGVQKIIMPYGSRLDSNVYYIAICDDCIEDGLRLDTIIQV